MRARVAERLDIAALLPGARTVMALACNYHWDDEASPVASYARGRDYHATMKDRLRRLRAGLKKHWPALRTYSSVDFLPVMEKVWAVRGGLGYVGKNGCLITEKFGSWVVLGTMVLDVEADAYATELATDRCGKCDLCIRACPTSAIVADKVIDARRCLSFLTIENEGATPDAFARGMQDIVFGCDVCQTVCPLNEHPLRASPRFEPRPVGRLGVREFAALTPSQYDALVKGTPLGRAGYDGLRRNAAYALGAVKDEGARALLNVLARDPAARVQEAARWALARLEENA